MSEKESISGNKKVKTLNRLTCFITYLPSYLCDNHEERKEAYKKGYTTTHWVNKIETHRYPRRFGDKYIKRGFNDIKVKLNENGEIPIERLKYI